MNTMELLKAFDKLLKEEKDIKEVVDDYNDKKNIMIEAIKRSEKADMIAYAASDLRADKDVMMEAVKKNGDNIAYAAEELFSDKELILEAVKGNGYNLKYASDELKDDKYFVLEAIRIDGYAFVCVSDRLKKDKQLILESIKQIDDFTWYNPLDYVPSYLKEDKQFMIDIIMSNLLAYEIVPPKFYYDYDIKRFEGLYLKRKNM